MEPENTDLYRLLQVDPRAEVVVIQAAYRVLARRHHPDLAGDDAVMKRLNAAWEVLQDPSRRAEYDRKRGSAPEASQETIISAAPKRSTAENHAGSPPGQPFGTVLTYGRYEGWSLGQIATVDPEFLEWLMSVPGGRYLRSEIVATLREVQGPRAGEARWGARGPVGQRMKTASGQIR